MSILDIDVPDWMAEGLCAQTDGEIFFPEKGGSTREAKAVCAVCPVRAQCLAYALEHEERFGLWGGLSERERRALKKGNVAVCALDGCETTFAVIRHNQRFCCPQHKRAAGQLAVEVKRRRVA